MKAILSTLGILGLIALFNKNPFIFLIVIIFLIFFKLLSSLNLRYLFSSLKNSQIFSITKQPYLVKLEGIAKMIQSVSAPINQKECIGYFYKIEEDYYFEGVKKYKTTHTEIYCEDFYLEDSTGIIKVKAKDNELQLSNFKLDKRYRKGDTRYSQYLLQKDNKISLIGKVISDNNQLVMSKDFPQDQFAAVPSSVVKSWILYKPLIQNALIFGGIMMISVIFISVIKLDNFKLKFNSVYLMLFHFFIMFFIMFWGYLSRKILPKSIQKELQIKITIPLLVFWLTNFIITSSMILSKISAELIFLATIAIFICVFAFFISNFKLIMDCENKNEDENEDKDKEEYEEYEKHIRTHHKKRRRKKNSKKRIK